MAESSSLTSWLLGAVYTGGTLCFGALFLLYMYQDRLLYFPTIPGASKFTRDNPPDIGYRLPNAVQLYRKVGVNVLLVDYRGFGHSEGEPSEEGLKLDAEAALDTMYARTDIDTSKLVVFGRSLGGAVSVHLAAKEPSRVAAVILENTFLSISSMVDALMPFLSYAKPLVLRMDWNNEKAIPALKQPILLIAGMQDELVPHAHMQRLRNLAMSSQRVVWYPVPGGTHNDSWLRGGDKYFTELRQFLEALSGGDLACLSTDEVSEETIASSGKENTIPTMLQQPLVSSLTKTQKPKVMVLQTTSIMRRAALLRLSSAARTLSSATSGQYLTMETRSNGVAIVRLDDKAAKVNTISSKMTAEMTNMLDNVENDPNIKSVVLISAKPGCFIAGADIAELQACSTEEEMRAMSSAGQSFMNRLAASKKPFVAAIEGSCMGGGMEVALACHYRVASQSKKTKLALPEVMLGLLPGAGGTQRLPKLIGIQAALDMMLTGKNIQPDKALRLGLVNQVADPYALESAAIAAAQQLAAGSLKPKKKNKGLVNRVLEDTPLRQVVFKKAGEMVEKKTGGHYPAPKLILESAQTGVENGLTKGLEVEAANFAKLGMTSEAKALMSIFFGQTALKKNRYGKPEKPVETMAVVGAGLMGAGIAQVSAAKGVRVLLKDRDASAAAKGEDYVRSNLDKKVKRKSMSIFDRDAVMANVVPVSDEDDVWKTHIKKADLAIEAVFEDLSLKHKVLSDLENYVPKDCVIATNTSALPIADIASACKRPENVIGMHYFSPVPSMPLLEIIRHSGTSDATAAKAVDLGLRQGKTCIVVKDVPGFYVNRCLGPYIAETLALVEDGVAPEYLDKIMTQWGLPVGPITLADEVGLDVAFHVNKTLSKALGVRMQGGDPKLFEEMIGQGFLGKKTGKGFFVQAPKGKKGKTINADAMNIVKKFQKTDLKLKDEDTTNRLVSRFVNEAVLCVQDDIIASPTEGDIGAVFGIGFPPFIGGPFRYVDLVGSTKFTEMMQRYADQYGEQFAPAPLLKDMAKTNKKFHSK
ncbi:hypothetical protein BBJ29_008196 [Phytophthora kernoviae]|uniref:Trifunctional enzyme subunit alpha, mitochondrial n=1 Tax=Phytophthora kernoviae TaxID=325452 RepID=A0A3R7JJ19_9STRA|nr:hypothetical protein BBJ29_008196 [Phytophthora kernoviae]